MIWKRIDKKNAILVSCATSHNDKPIVRERVRGEMPFVVKLVQESEDICKFTFWVSLSLGGSVPDLIVDHYVKNVLQVTETVQQYFQQLRPLDKLNADDGKAMAEALTTKYSETEKQEAKDHHHSITHILVLFTMNSHVVVLSR